MTLIAILAAVGLGQTLVLLAALALAARYDRKREHLLNDLLRTKGGAL